jgi:hypothetical protein
MWVPFSISRVVNKPLPAPGSFDFFTSRAIRAAKLIAIFLCANSEKD